MFWSRGFVPLTLALVITACSQAPSTAPEQDLSPQFGTVQDDFAYDVATTNDFVYVLGSSGRRNGVPFASDLGHVFLKRFDRSGKLTWTRNQNLGQCDYDDCYFDPAVGLGTDRDGNAYGAYDVPSGSEGHTSFVMKYDEYGVLRWKRQLYLSGATLPDGQGVGIEAHAMAVDGQGNSYILSRYYLFTVEDEGGPPAPRTYKPLFSKYGPGGELLWQQEVAASSVAVAGDGMVYVVSGQELAKYGNDGSLKWSRTVDAKLASIAVNGSNEIYVASAGSTDADKVALYKYDRNGTRRWSKTIPIRYEAVVHDIATDGVGSVYLTGWTRVNATAKDDIFTRKHNRDGGLVWSRRLDLPTTSDQGLGVATFSRSEAYVVGSTNARVNGKNFGNYDAFLLRLNNQGQKVWSR